MPFSPTFMNTFQETFQHAEEWLKPIAAEMNVDTKGAYHGLRAVLHVLRDRLTVEESAHLAAHMPMLIRGLFYEGWTPSGKPVKIKTQEAFYRRVLQQFDFNDPVPVEHWVQTVFKLLSQKVASGEIKDIIHNLPNDLRQLWPMAA